MRRAQALLGQSLARADHDRHKRPKATGTSGEAGGLADRTQVTQDDAAGFGGLLTRSRLKRSTSLAALLKGGLILGVWLAGFDAAAQGYGPPPGQPGYGQPPPGYPPPGYGQPPPGYPPPGYPPPGYSPPRSNKRDDVEIGVLYVTSVAYGVGMGIWLSAEMGLDDPGLFLIPPAILGVAAPAGVYFLDDPSMDSGLPAAIAAGAAIGAGEGIGIASYQFVSTEEEDAWGFRGLSRATALGATAGGVAGYAFGYYLEPPPEASLFVSSGVLLGTAIGSMYGYGASEAGVGYGNANDSAALGGLIGFNLGLAATVALTNVYEPGWGEIGWMWAGAGIGAAVSLPVFLFYAGEDEPGEESPPAKRGFLFMGTATTLGLLAGAIFSSGAADDYTIGERRETGPRLGRWARVDYVAPLAMPGALGVQVGGTVF
jgi:hypothetical protein